MPRASFWSIERWSCRVENPGIYNEKISQEIKVETTSHVTDIDLSRFLERQMIQQGIVTRDGMPTAEGIKQHIERLRDKQAQPQLVGPGKPIIDISPQPQPQPKPAATPEPAATGFRAYQRWYNGQ